MTRNNKGEYLPTSLSQVKSLQHIYLNQIHEFPKVLLDMPQLKTLHMDGKAHLPKDIDRLKNLESLNLMFNNTNQIPSSVGNLIQLKKLVLPSLKDIPTSFINLKKLEYLKIYRDNINTARNFPQVLKSLTTLKELMVLDSGFPTFNTIAQSLRKLPHLKKFSYIGDLKTVPSEVYELTQLDELYLRKVIYKGEKPEATIIPLGFAKISQLRTLSLMDMNLTKLPPGIYSLKKLKRLNLRGSNINKSELPALKTS